MRARGRVMALTASALFFAPTALAFPVWPGRLQEIPYGVDLRHPFRTGDASERRDGYVPNLGPVEAPSEVWRTPLGAGRPSTPALSRDGVLYIPNAGGLHALAADGQLLWSISLGFVASTPSITTEGDLVVGTQAGELVVVASDGSIKSRRPVNGAVRGSPLVLPDGSIAVSTFDRTLYRIDWSGRELFRRAVNWPSSGPLAWDGSVLIAAFSDRVSFVSSDGDLLRSVAVGAPIMGGPSLGRDGTVWLLGQDMSVRRLSPGSSVVESVELGVPVGPKARLAIAADGSVRIPTRGDALLCLGPEGSERWRVSGEGSFLGGALVDGEGRTYAVNHRGVLLGIDSAGRVLWRTRLLTRSDVTPVLGDDGSIYVVDVRGTVYAFR